MPVVSHLKPWIIFNIEYLRIKGASELVQSDTYLKKLKKNEKKKCIRFKFLQDVYGLNNLSEPKISKFDQVGANFTI